MEGGSSVSKDSREKEDPPPDPVLEDLVWLQTTREDRLAKARGDR